MFTLISDVIADNLFLFRVLGSILIFVLFWALKGTITKAVVKLLTKLLNRSRQIADQSTLRFVLGPLKHFLAVSGLYLALMNLHPGAGWSDFFLKVYRIAVIILISIVLLRLCDCASDNLFQPFGKQEELENRLNKTLMTLLKKAAKVLILIIAGIAVLSETGINVATLITGIGLGGLTIALAAQDTAQNLFGGLVILLDKRPSRWTTGSPPRTSRAWWRTSPSAPPGCAPSRTRWSWCQIPPWSPPPSPTGRG